MNQIETGGVEPSTGANPRPFSEIPTLWLQVAQMSEEFFSQEAPRASGSNTLISVAILAAATALISALVSFLQPMPPIPGFADFYTPGIPTFTICITLFVSLITFFLGNGLTYLGARVFGGSGAFGTQLYLQSLFVVPLGILVSLLSLLQLVPLLGTAVYFIAAFALVIYGIILNVRVFKVAHSFTTGRAIGAIFSPVLILAVIPCLVILILALLGPAIGDVFSNIIENI